MNVIWKKIPIELLTNIFKCLHPKYIKTEIIRWLTKPDLQTMLRKADICESTDNYTACILLQYNIDWNIISNYHNLLLENSMTR